MKTKTPNTWAAVRRERSKQAKADYASLIEKMKANIAKAQAKK